MSGNYDDIITLPHHVSPTRPQMSLYDRATQFSPFAALSGFGAAITETGRLTDAREALDEQETRALNEALRSLWEHLSEHPRVRVTYFQPDEKKAGGAYRTDEDEVKSIDLPGGLLVLRSRVIRFENLKTILLCE